MFWTLEVSVRLVLLLAALYAAWNSKRLVRRYVREWGWPKRLERDARLALLSFALLTALTASLGLFRILVLSD